MRRINDALGRFYSTLVYVYLSVTLGKDRHIHTVTLGKDRHIHIRMHACCRAPKREVNKRRTGEVLFDQGLIYSFGEEGMQLCNHRNFSVLLFLEHVL